MRLEDSVTLPWGESLKDFNKRMNPLQKRSYTDEERGYSEYDVLNINVKFKHPQTGEWIEAVLYENETGTYVREKEDFLNKFELI